MTNWQDTLQQKFDEGLGLHRQGKLAEAERIYSEILQQRPNHFHVLHLLGVIALQTRRTERAVELMRNAIALNENDAAAHNNLGNALRDLNRPEDALSSYDKAIALKPDYALAYVNRGLALKDLKRHEDALTSYDRAIALKRDFAEAYLNQGICLLLMGRFEQGFRQYEWRKKRRDEPVAVRSYPQPVWLGEENIIGKTLFIYWEQGLGDTIQFCRYAKLLESHRAKVIMSVQQPLYGLLKQITPTIQVIGPNEAPTDFDYHCPLPSLPLAMETALETIPAEHHYIKANEEQRVAWSGRLPPRTKPRIGVVWSGGTSYKGDHNRSIELETILPILSTDADWICLQKDVRKKDLTVLRQVDRIAYFGDDLGDFSNTAALLDLMDLVIAVDTNIAHLAGAMGKPVWILLSYSHHWVWLLDRADSPWYPSARLFRQQQIGNWAGVIDQVKSELRSVIL
jgi:tetratricopeptide (TPR) repeat protein